MFILAREKNTFCLALVGCVVPSSSNTTYYALFCESEVVEAAVHRTEYFILLFAAKQQHSSSCPTISYHQPTSQKFYQKTCAYKIQRFSPFFSLLLQLCFSDSGFGVKTASSRLKHFVVWCDGGVAAALCVIQVYMTNKKDEGKPFAWQRG